MSDLLLTRTADISPCGQYRYRLERRWNHGVALLPFVMLNPSTADADIDDPTIRRCMGFARREHFGGIVVANLYAFRATSPDDLWRAQEPEGRGNLDALYRIAREARFYQVPIICAWGIHGGKNNRPIATMQQAGADLKCFGLTKDGHPRHPLYVRADQPLERFR